MEKVIMACKNDLKDKLEQLGYLSNNGCVIIKYDRAYVYIIKANKKEVRDKYLDSEWKQFKGYKYFYGIKYHRNIDLVKTMSLFIDNDIIIDDDYGHVMKIDELYAKITGRG